MRLGICANHSFPGHMGGVEQVIKQLSETLTKKYSYECVIFSKSCQQEITHNSVKIVPISLNVKEFVKQVNSHNLDHLFIYSDSFCHWEGIIDLADQIKCGKSIVLVGMDKMLGNPRLLEKFKKQSHKFSVLAHSDNHIDYLTCKVNGIKVQAMPYWVDLMEFDIVADFREKYGIDGKIILNVANFFPGKGHEYIIPILEQVEGDFTFVSISSTINFEPGNKAREDFARRLKGCRFKSLVLSDILRRDVISAFYDSNVFIFPSQKEVGPLVILESMATALPYIAFPVGITPKLRGGTIIPVEHKGPGGYYMVFAETMKLFAQKTTDLLKNNNVAQKMGLDGHKQIEDEYDLDKAITSYHQVFSQKDKI